MSMENQLTTDMYKRYIELLILIFHFLEEDIESSTTVLIGWKKCGGIHCSQNVEKNYEFDQKDDNSNEEVFRIHWKLNQE